jgi:hypothetical protein
MPDTQTKVVRTVADKDSGPEAVIKGVIEDVKGKAKADEARQRAEQ